MRVNIGGKAIPESFLKIEGRGRSLGRKTGERGQDTRIGIWSESRSCSTSQEQERARVERAKEMSGEKRWRRVGVSGSLRGGDQKRSPS